MFPLLAVGMGGIVASGGDGCIAGLCKVGWANVRQPENVLRWFGGKRDMRERVGLGAMG